MRIQIMRIEQTAKEKERKPSDKYVDNGTLMAIVDMWWFRDMFIPSADGRPKEMPAHIKDILHDLELDGCVFKNGTWSHTDKWKGLDHPETAEPTDWGYHENKVYMRFVVPVGGQDGFFTRKAKQIWDFFKHTPVKLESAESMRSAAVVSPGPWSPAPSSSQKDSTSQA